MLFYLSMNTRPDIAFVVRQVAWFNSNPMQSHASAVKMIIRYLSTTSDKGITFTLPLISRLIVMWMQTSLDYMEENLRTYLQVPTLILDTSCSSVPTHLEKLTLNRYCTQHLPCRIYCPLIRNSKPHHHPMSSPRTCTLPTHCLHNS